MQAFLKRTIYCAAAVLGVIVVVGIIKAMRGTLLDAPHTVFDWISAVVQTVLAAVLVGAFLSLWLGFGGIKWPEPIKRIGVAYERLLGLFFIVGGAVEIGAAVFYLGRQVLRWSQTGIWETVPLSRLFPVLPHLHWAFAETVFVWLMGTPAWVWVALVGVLLIRMGLANLSTENSEADT